MTSTMITAAKLEPAAKKVPAGARISNINFVRFKDQVYYENHAELNQPLSGKEAFVQRYVPAVEALTKKLGLENDIKPTYRGAPLAAVLGAEDGEDWDMVNIISYTGFEVLRKLFG